MKAELLNITEAAYHANEFSQIPCYSNSIGKILLNKSPQHAWLNHPLLNPDYEAGSEEKFALGTVAHAALLQGLDVCKPLDYADYRTGDAKAERDSSYLAGKIPMLIKQYEEVQLMVDSAGLQITKALGGLVAGKAEQTILVSDDDLTLIKMRLDWLSVEKNMIIDYKTTDIASPEQWMKSIAQNGYDMQAALYTKGVEVLTGKAPDFVFAVQEVKAPYSMYFIGMNPQYLEFGQSRNNRALAMWENCVRINQWPSYDNRIMYPDMPGWVEAQWQEKEAMLEYDNKSSGIGKWTAESFLFGKVK